MFRVSTRFPEKTAQIRIALDAAMDEQTAAMDNKDTLAKVAAVAKINKLCRQLGREEGKTFLMPITMEEIQRGF